MKRKGRVSVLIRSNERFRRVSS